MLPMVEIIAEKTIETTSNNQKRRKVKKNKNQRGDSK